MAKETVFQKLNRVLGNELESPKYAIDPNSFKDLDSKELELKKLEAQQTVYLQNQWRKIDNELYQKAVYYEPTRIASYYDFEGMEFTPEIAAALDIFAEEASCPNEHGKILTIYSDSDRIKDELTELFDNVIDINSVITSWIRNTIKYGDNFIYNKVIPGKGIVGVTQLPNIEITRSEPGFSKVVSMDDFQKEKNVKFYWKSKDIDFNSFEISHFRLLGDDRKLPYGTSILEKSRKIWKQLLLAEDAMLVYRITRAPERRVYKVYVGNMDEKDIDPYVDKVANSFKRANAVNSNNGQQDTRYNAMSVDQDFFIPTRDPALPMPIETLPGACISLDTMIPLLDGRVLTLNEIINLWDSGDRNLWVYSCDPITGKSLPAPITWAGVTRKNTNVLKITLDNGESIITTPDHKFVHRTNGFVEAQNLNEGDSLMPFYTKNSKIRSNTNEYQQVWDNKTQTWEFTHRFVKKALIKYGLINDFIFDDTNDNLIKNVIHHKDFNRFNNNPDNLLLMDSNDHIKYHQHNIKNVLWGDENKSKTNRDKISIGLKKHIDGLSDIDKKNRFNKNIHSPESIKKVNDKMIEWTKNPENLKKRGKSVSIGKSSEKVKNQIIINNKKMWSKDGHREKVFSKEQKIVFNDQIYNTFLSIFEKTLRVDKTLEILNNDTVFINTFREINSDIRSSLTNLNEFTNNHVNKMFISRGFKNFTEWKKQECFKRGYINQKQWKYNIDKKNKYNHKIVKIEYLEEKIDTGTITVDGNELYSKSHTFATQCGIYIKNSNLGDIEDIVYIQNKLLAALRIPKTFLGFDQAVGDGKNLSILDIRFARTINRIQRAIIQELNKMAIIHLYTKGYEDDLDNFTLSLSNPSTQADMLKVTNWKEKVSLYRDAVTDAGNGFGAMSMTFAKKEIFGLSDDEIKLDIQRQAVEKAASEELKMLSETIKQTGIFRDLYGLYKIDPTNMGQIEQGDEQQDQAPSSGGGGFGGGESPDVAQDFTTPLTGDEVPGEEPTGQGAGDENAEEPTGIPGSDDEEIKLKEGIIRKVLVNKGKHINEAIGRTLSEIDKIISD